MIRDKSISLHHLQDGRAASRPTYRLVQVLRAVAALMVVLHHEVESLWQRMHVSTFGQDWVNGRAGVDVFFVISGFVMAISSEPLRGTRHPARTFLARRLERVVPLYWLLTTVKLVLLHWQPELSSHGGMTTAHAICSYLFVPWVWRGYPMDPVLVVGWTLNFEMLFYVLFSVALALRVRAVTVLAPAFAVLMGLYLFVVGAPVALRWYGQPLLLEFLFGILLAQSLHRVRRIPPAAAVVGALAAFVPLLLWSAPNFSPWRPLGWGVPAQVLVMSAVALESRLGARSPRWLLELGDASYSIYLVHGFVIPLCVVLLAHAHSISLAWKAGAMLVMLGASSLAGVMVYRAVERPMMQWFKSKRQTAVLVVA